MNFSNHLKCCLRGVFRWGIWLINMVFLLSGIALIAMGIIVVIESSSYEDFYTGDPAAAGIVLIVAGVLTSLLSFLGCCGAMKKSVRMTYAYAGGLFFLFAFQLIGAIVLLSSKPAFEDAVSSEMKITMAEYPDNGAAWDDLQRDRKCCGIWNYVDWEIYNPTLGGVPDSCNCTDNFYGCLTYEGKEVYGIGCHTKLMWELFPAIDALGGSAITFSFFQLIGAIFAIFLARSFKKARIQEKSDGSESS